MKPEVEGGLLVTANELAERLGQELTITDWRAVVAVVVADPKLEQEADEALGEALDAAGIGSPQVVHSRIRRDDSGKEQLEALNRARETLLQEKRLVLLRAASATDVRFLRKTAPDLTSAIDLFVELRPDAEAHASWPTCREQLRALMEDRHGSLDFTGLLPATVEHRRLPLAELYQPLVDPYPAEHSTLTHLGGLLVLGHPGTGKTTFIRHLAWVYARGEGDPLEIGAKVPLLLSLSDYGYEREHDRVSSLVDFLPRWVAEQGVEQAGSLPANLPDVLLLLDGLDEIRDAHARLLVLGEVNALLRGKHIGGAVVTGRSFLVDELHQEDTALRLASTREPTWEEITEFLEKFVELRRGSADKARGLVRRVERDRDLRALARTPLVLAFMAILDELEGRLPDRRIEIYYRLGEMLVERWTRARSIGSSAHRRERPTRADALRVLGPLAWWTVEQGGGAVPEEELSKQIERIEARREPPAEASRRAKTLLELLRTDTAMLVPQPPRRWSFVHSSIAEYFAGVEAERDRARWRGLLDDPFRAEWREIVLFCAGHLGVVEGRNESLDALIRAVLEKSRRKGRYGAKFPSLIIGLLRESPGLSRRQIDLLVERLLELVLVPAYSYAAALQTQLHFSLLLHEAHGPVKDSLGVGLRRWFSDFAEHIEWERFLKSTSELPLDVLKLDAQGTHFVALAFALGPLFSHLCLWAPLQYSIDLRPTIALWQRKSDWRFRLAEWLVDRDDAERGRPFSEVVQELGLE